MTTPEEPYEYRTNFNDKEFSQGTLFQVDPSLKTDESRYPRGYTPERHREVDAAIGQIQFFGDAREKAKANRGIHDEWLMLYDGRAQATVRDAIKRSTIPTEDLHGLRSIEIDDESDSETNTGHGTVLAAYSQIEDGSEGDIRLEPTIVDPIGSNGIAHALIHEIGHHVSYKEGNWSGGDPDDFTAALNDDTGQGVEEGRADAYADKHVRYDKRAGEWDASEDRPWRSGYDHIIRHQNEDERNQDEFTQGYLTQRHIPLNPPGSSVVSHQQMAFHFPDIRPQSTEWDDAHWRSVTDRHKFYDDSYK